MMTNSTVNTSIPLDSPITIRPTDIWIGDLLFTRHNRSLKYTQNGNPLILAESFQWDELKPRLVENLGWLCVHADAVVLNFLLLVLSFRKTRQQAYHKKAQFLVGNLAVCNIVLALGLFVYTFLVDIYYDVNSFDTLLYINGKTHNLGEQKLWEFAKLLIHSELVENFFLVQQWILLLASLDRYFSLLWERYSPHAKHKYLMIAISLVPYLIALVLLDRNLLLLWVHEKTANLVRLLGLLCPLLLSLVLCTCSILGLCQQRQLLRRVFGPLFGEELSFSAILMAVLCLDAIAKFGLFLELLSRNFSVQITTGQTESDAHLHAFLEGFYKFSHFLLLLSPLAQSLTILLGINFYRHRLLRLLGRTLRCRRRPPVVDYSCETMRSIIAEQNRQRQMRSTGAETMGITTGGSRKIGVVNMNMVNVSKSSSEKQERSLPRRK